MREMLLKIKRSSPKPPIMGNGEKNRQQPPSEIKSE
jgi:hypothetical protein